MKHRIQRRLGTVVLAPVAAAAAWAVIRLMGIDLVVSVGDAIVGPIDVVITATVAALGGWLVIRLLESHSRRPRSWWAFIGSTALAVSIIGPTWVADGASGAALIVLHLVVAIVVIAGFASTLPIRRADAAGRTYSMTELPR